MTASKDSGEWSPQNEDTFLEFQDIQGNQYASLFGSPFGKAAGVIGGELGENAAKAAVTNASRKDAEREWIEGFKERAAIANKKLPIIIDQDTRMDRVSVGPGLRVVYHQTLTRFSSKEVDARQLDTILRDDIVNKACASKEIEVGLRFGAIYAYAYSGKDGVEIHRIEVVKKTCGF